jgi:hypothetical protein
MAIKKELSKRCVVCGVEWLKDLSNKKSKRAKCLDCYEKEGIENRILRTKLDKENSIVPNRTELYKNYKVENRTEFWKAINKEIKPLKDREQIRAFISKQMDRILEDKTLMDYINLTEIVEKTKTKTK